MSSWEGPWGCLPGGMSSKVCVPRGCVYLRVSAWGGVPAQGAGAHVRPPVGRILDTRLSKHYLSATTVADGNNVLIWRCDVFVKAT